MKTIYIKIMEERNMGKTRKLYGTTFYGNEVSEYAKKQGYLDYATLSRAFDAVLNNDIIRNTWESCGEWEQIHGFMDDVEQEEYKEPEIYQCFIVSEYGAEIIQRFTDDPVFYNDALNMYVWGITHWGTSWDYVLTDVKLNCGQEAWE